MPSSPPQSASTTDPTVALPRLDRSALRSAAALECDLCIAFDTSRAGLPGGLASNATAVGRRVSGRVTAVTPERLVLTDAHGRVTQVRLLLPAALDLGPLLDTEVELELVHDLSGRRPTVDAVLRDAQGQLLLWARDGALPGPRGAHGLVVRVTHDGGLPRLVLAASGATASAARGSVAELLVGRTQLTLAALRVEGHGASFLVVRC